MSARSSLPFYHCWSEQTLLALQRTKCLPVYTQCTEYIPVLKPVVFVCSTITDLLHVNFIEFSRLFSGVVKQNLLGKLHLKNTKLAKFGWWIKVSNLHFLWVQAKEITSKQRCWWKSSFGMPMGRPRVKCCFNQLLTYFLHIQDQNALFHFLGLKYKRIVFKPFVKYSSVSEISPDFAAL